MSHTVLRGCPTASQLHLDIILDAIIKENRNKKRRKEVNLAEIIYYCLKKRTKDIFMINGSNGEKITNGQILSYAVPLTKAILSQNKQDRNIMIMMNNSQYMASLYYAALFAGAVPLLIDSNSTVYEIRHFVELVSPYIIFCEYDRLGDVKAAIGNLKYFNDDIILLVPADGEHIQNFCAGHNGDLGSFQICNKFGRDTAVLLPTSGSTGLPKATLLSHKGLIAQLAVLWFHHNHFPQPTKMAMLLSSAQWMTHTILMTSCPVYGVALLMTPKKATVAHVLDVISTFKPTWALLAPKFAQALVQSALPRELECLETIVLTGAPLTLKIANILKEKLPVTCYFGSGVGMTETHGFFTMPGPNTAWNSNDNIINTWLYQLVNENGKVLESKKNGELLLKSSTCSFMGYYNNPEESRQAVTSDGWLATGDVFFVDDNEEMHFVERKKFWFKYCNYHISPIELETIIGSVAGVQDCVVCDCEKGPAAAVVLQPGFSTDISTHIHSSVNSTLSDYKRLRGGIVFVPSLPYTHSGKLKRAECTILIQKLMTHGNVF